MRALIQDVLEKKKARLELEDELARRIEALDRGEGVDMTGEDWRRLKDGIGREPRAGVQL